MKKSDRERRTDASTCKMMPQNFEPGPYEVLIGRGRTCTNHWGNQRFRGMVRDELAAYTAVTDCKRSKSVIIGRILGDIQKHSPHAGFVKKDADTGRWLSLTAAASRVAIAQAFRDALANTYRSSKHSKQVKRRVERTAQQTKPQDAQVGHKKGGDVFAFDTLDLEPLPLDQTCSSADHTTISASEFDSLFAAFTQDVSMQDDPFEPAPIAPTPLPRADTHSRSDATKENLAASSYFGSDTPFRVIRVAMSA